MTFRQITVFVLVGGFVAVAVATLLDLGVVERPPHVFQNTSHTQKWYLMVPRAVPGMHTAVSFGAPLSRWKRLQSYDNEQVCARRQAELQEYAKKQIAGRAPTDQQQEDYLRAYVQTQFSQCVASDDSRMESESDRLHGAQSRHLPPSAAP
jgi:hypothetical protein